MTTAWMVLALGEEREHAGNDGYDDNPAEHYSWDSTVQNHARLAVGDVIALWDKAGLIGVSVIQAIDTGAAEKTLYSCPRCTKADIKKRLRQRPSYRCGKCLHVFDDPATETRPVITYTSRHGKAWMDGRGLLSAVEVRALCDSPKSQLSMRPARWEKLRDALLATEQAEELTPPGSETPPQLLGGHRVTTVRARVGQDAFRKSLLKEYGEQCAFSGPTPAAALDAAHLYSFAESGEHHEWGGLLLRRDIHSLFDRGQIAIAPGTGRIDVVQELLVYPLYAQLHDQAPAVQLRPAQQAWLSAHWRTHRG
ncbi:HNH endonuclease [Streptomyces hydrogenans]|uniref:HNH endonuclease n=1 Tax=Streptomyces hydrogenans TaxID=1873719 RepID=UPI0035D5FE7D